MSGSSSSGAGGNQAHDASAAEMSKILGSGVTKMQHVERPMGTGVTHSGVVCSTAKGDFLVHKGSGFGASGGETVAVDARHMSSAWKSTGAAVTPSARTTVSDAVAAGGRNYNASFSAGVID